MRCKFKVSGTTLEPVHALLEAHGNAEPSASTQFHLDPQTSDTQQPGWWPSQLASALGHSPHGWTGQRRPCLLASISLAQGRVASASTTDGADRDVTRPEGTSSAAGTAQPKPSGKRKTAPWLLATPLPSAFLRAQRLAQTILQYYKDKGETFPRPCPVCGECEFLEPCHAHPPASHSNRSITPSLSSDNKPHETGTSVASNPLGGGGRVKWESRPLACEQCHRWWHVGCLGIHSLDELPTSPWFHSKECRHTYLALEADAEAGQLPAWELGMKPGAFSVEMMTDADHRSFVLGAFDGGRGDMTAVYDLLSRSFPSQSVLGYGAAGAEFAGGKYAMLLRSKGEPVAVATFDAYGPHAAQLHLLATAPEARGKGHARALLDVLEHRLSKVGVTRLIAQPRAASLDMFTGSLGWEVVHPADAMQIHAQIPIAFFDTALVEKQLL